MCIPTDDYVQYLLETVGEDGGDVASYFPELAQADIDRLVIAIAPLNGEV